MNATAKKHSPLQRIQRTLLLGLGIACAAFILVDFYGLQSQGAEQGLSVAKEDHTQSIPAQPVSWETPSTDESPLIQL